MGDERKLGICEDDDEDSDVGGANDDAGPLKSQEIEILATPSPLGSSPPQDFDVNIEDQYIPIILDENYDDLDRNPDQISSSLASSLSIGSDQDYATSPVILSTNIRCPICEKPMRTFYCAKCIQKGKFVTLDSQMTERFSELNIKRDNQKRELIDDDELLKVGQNIDEDKAMEEMLQIKLRTLKRKTEALKTLYNDQRLKLDETKDLLRETRQQVEMEKKSYKSKESKIELIKRFIASRKASVKKRQTAELDCFDELKQHARRRVYQLIQDVFPIEEVNLFEQDSSFVNMETSPLLTFSDGSHHQIEQQSAHSIVEPWLPSNGDYSAYSLWVNDNQDQLPASVNDLSERNPAFRISAALAYTTQLVKNIASYLDVILPARMDLDMFSRELLNDSQFSYNVAKLNANVIHLCVSQGVDISLLNSQRTLKNMMLLFNINICDLGRKSVIELDNEEVANKIEDQLAKDLSIIREDFYDFTKFADDDDVSDSEWEMSDTINPMEMQLATEQSIQQNSYISRLPMRLFASFWTATGN